MKKKHHIVYRIVRTAGLFFAAPLAATALAAEPKTLPLPAPMPGLEAKHTLTEVTFLGVLTRSADPAVTAQLELPAETGLLVMEVLPDSPASGVLKKHDLLVRLDDQILIETRQLGVLVRSRKAGDEVKLAFFRGGKEQTVRVKLGKRQTPEPSGKLLNHARDTIFFRSSGGAPGHALRFGGGEVRPGEMRISRFEHKDAVLVFDDGFGRLELNFKDGRKHVTARNAKGDVVFSGPAETPEERKAMPAEVRARLEKMEATDVRVPVPPEPSLPPAPAAGVRSIPATHDAEAVPFVLPLEAGEAS